MHIMGKGAYFEKERHGYNDWLPHPEKSGAVHTERKISLNVEEARDIFGDEQTAEDYGYVNRGLKSRHIQFLALGGTIGTGLFLGIGRAFTQAGPLSLLLGYTITGVAIYAMMMSLGEMATWLPLPGAIPQFCARYVDPAMGFAVGWNTWYQCAITLCAEISAAGVVIQFWEGTRDINIAAWISIIIVLIVSLNIFMVSVYGEAEFWFASIKLITIVGLLIFAFIIDLGGGPKRDRLGFRYWRDPGAMKEFVASGDTGRFLGLWSTLVNAAFSYAGVEMVAVAAGEAQNPRVNIPKAVRRVFWRIMLFYILGSLAIGVLLPYDDQMLLNAQKLGKDNTAASPWVVAAYRAAVPVLPSVINVVILTSATSSANAYLYTGARVLYALAQNGQAPRQLLYCSRRGIPYYCIMVTASIGLLTFMSCTKGSSTVFTWFQNLVVIANLFTWMSVSIAYIRFHAALKAQGVDRNLFGTVFSNPPNATSSDPAYQSGSTHSRQQHASSAPHYHNGKPISQPYHHPNSHPRNDNSKYTLPAFNSRHHAPSNPPMQPLKPPPPVSSFAPPSSSRKSSLRALLNGTPFINPRPNTEKPLPPPPYHDHEHHQPLPPNSQFVHRRATNLSTSTTLHNNSASTTSTVHVRSSPTNAGGEAHYHMPFRSPFQPYLAWFSLTYFALVVIFNGFYVFPSTAKHRQEASSSSPPPPANTHSPSSTSSFTTGHNLSGSGGNKPFDLNDFITSYAGIPIYFGLYLFWKIFKRTQVVDPRRADIWTGKRALDEAVWGDGGGWEGGWRGVGRGGSGSGNGKRGEQVGAGVQGDRWWQRLWRWMV